jgi:hypothetical protein
VLVLATRAAALAQGTEDAFVAKIPGQSMTASVTLSPAVAKGASGAALQVPINLTSQGTAAPATFQTDLSFDQTKLSFTSAQAGAQLTLANKSLTTTVLSNGNVRFLASGLNQTVIANGLVAYATLTLSPQFLIGSTAVTLSNCTSSSALGGSLSTGCTAGTVTAFTCDLNGDGVVNVVDVQLIINEALGVIPPIHDLNGDGVVNVADVQLVINAALGLGCVY